MRSAESGGQRGKTIGEEQRGSLELGSYVKLRLCTRQQEDGSARNDVSGDGQPVGGCPLADPPGAHMPTMKSWLELGRPSARRLGVRSLLPDRGLPARNSARQQSQHPGLPLV